MRERKWEQLPDQHKELVEAAIKALNFPYNPYSRFDVGAALLTRSGEIITGANVENASYGMTICAERAAIFAANAQGKRVYDAIAVATRGKEPSFPCGGCRQVIYEFSQVSENNMDVLVTAEETGQIIVESIDALLPQAFGPKDLGIDLSKYRK